MVPEKEFKMKIFSVIALALAISSSALATEPMKVSALSIFLNNINSLQFVPSEASGYLPDVSVASTFAAALAQGSVRVSTVCQYRNRSFLEDCVLQVTPAAGEGRGKLYIYKFTKLRTLIVTNKVSLNIAL
jgi:hypothetical protein